MTATAKPLCGALKSDRAFGAFCRMPVAEPGQRCRYHLDQRWPQRQAESAAGRAHAGWCPGGRVVVLEVDDDLGLARVVCTACERASVWARGTP